MRTLNKVKLNFQQLKCTIVHFLVNYDFTEKCTINPPPRITSTYTPTHHQGKNLGDGTQKSPSIEIFRKPRAFVLTGMGEVKKELAIFSS